MDKGEKLVPRPEPREPELNHASQEVHANDKVPFVPATVSNVGTRLTTSMALVDLVERLRQKRFTLPIHGHSTCAADPDVVKWEDVEAFLAAAVRPASAPSRPLEEIEQACREMEVIAKSKRDIARLTDEPDYEANGMFAVIAHVRETLERLRVLVPGGDNVRR